MTPADEAGLKVGDYYRVTYSDHTQAHWYSFADGSIVCFIEDDGSTTPLFSLTHDHYRFGTEAYEYIHAVHPLTPEEQALLLIAGPDALELSEAV